MFTEDDLNHYGVPLQIYRGEGVLVLSTEQQVKCRFAASQTENGKVFLLCVSEEVLWDLVIGGSEISSFSGITDDELNVETMRNIYETQYLPHTTPAEGTCLALNANLKVSRSSELSCCRRTFTLVNLAGVTRRFSCLFHGRHIVIRSIEDSLMNLKRLSAIRDVLPTAELEIEASSPIESDIELVNEVCYLLSIAVGTKVQWIAHTDWSLTNDWIARSHYGLHVTKGYVPLPLIDLGRSSKLLEIFLGVVGNKDQVSKRKLAGLTHAVVDTYLDAKAESDFLQARALKLVIAVEMLKAEFQSARDINPLGILEHDYDKLRKPIKMAVRSAISDNTTSAERKIIYSNLGGLNRKTFKQQLGELLAALGLDYCDDDLNRFVASRNKLVHEGRFYCEKASDQDKARILPFDSPSKEWFWLLHFCDRIILKASGYSGSYLNWSTPEDPKSILL
jgi:hypothetical protein